MSTELREALEAYDAAMVAWAESPLIPSVRDTTRMTTARMVLGALAHTHLPALLDRVARLEAAVRAMESVRQEVEAAEQLIEDVRATLDSAEYVPGQNRMIVIDARWALSIMEAAVALAPLVRLTSALTNALGPDLAAELGVPRG